MIDKYHYGGALEILEDMELKESPIYPIINSCMYAVNFDFKTSYYILSSLPEEVLEYDEIKELLINLNSLIEGDPLAVFSELIDNIKFQLSSKEYIDFLGRVYRCKEAIFKYLFIQHHLNKGKFSFHLDIMSKRRILKVLRKKYRIFNSNLIYGITTYLNRFQNQNSKYMEIVKILNSEKMTDLIELRNNSIVGHGFKGVSREDIAKIYGNPYNVIDDFVHCLKLLNLNIEKDKYRKINEFIKSNLKELINNKSTIN